MNESLSRRVNLFGAWCGLFYVIVLFVGWWAVAGFFPLHSPSAGAAEIAAIFRDNRTGITAGMVIIMWSAAIYLPFAATLADAVAEVEGRNGPLSRMVLLAGYGNAMLTFYPPLWWIANTFRADIRTDEMIYMFNDVAWLQFIGGLSLVMPAYGAVALLAFTDKSANPVFPRWLGFVSILTSILILPDQLLFFFKSGPFAWNGLFGFWVPVAVFSIWILVVFWVLRQRYSAAGAVSRAAVAGAR
jgi:hypothetical protein